MDLENPNLIQEEIKHAGTSAELLFREMGSDEDVNQTGELTELESLCMSCHKTVCCCYSLMEMFVC